MSEKKEDKVIEVVKETKKNRSSLISRIVVVLLIVIGGAIYINHAESTSYNDEDVQIWTEERLSKEDSLEYAILDVSVVEEDEVLNKWYKQNVKKEGLSAMNHKGFTYFMVSGGTQTIPGFAIQLFDIKEGKREVYVGYNILSPEETQTKNENKLPHMIVRIKETEKPIRERLISDDKKAEEKE